MSFIPRPHEIYKHFKGNLYQVTAIAEHTETGEQLVIYQALYDQSRIFARPLSMFVERVDRDRYPQAGQEFRFQLQGPEAARQQEELGGTGAAGQQELQGAGTMRQQEGLQRPAGQQEVLLGPEGAQSGNRSPEGDAGANGRTGEAFEECSEDQETVDIDPFVLEFLDSDSYEQRLNILAGLHHRITDEMITTMAIACDIEIDDGDVEERYEALKNCLLTLERFECNRLR